MKRIKRFSLLPAILASFYAAACANGGGDVKIFPPPPPIGNFSNSSLSGQYAFSMSGSEICGLTSSFFTRAGTFTADGSGHITTGVEDVNVCAGTATLQFTSGSYAIQSDGRGTLRLTNSTGTTSYAISLSSASQGFIVQTDQGATASGSLRKQDLTAFSATKIAGGYVFDFSGISNALTPESIIGRFDADGGGGIQQGLFDSNINGVLSGQKAFTGSYLLDAAFPQSGRGTATIAGHNFAFYIVDATRLKFVGTGFPEAFFGEAVTQANTFFTQTSLNGSFAFLIGGASSAGPVATAGRFSADGAGHVTSVVLDENNNGGHTGLPGGTITATYTIDANGFGGGSLTIADSTAGTFSFIFYLASPVQAVLQETDTGIVSDGAILAQTGSPINAALLAGNYSFNWTGVTLDQEDFSGQLALSNASPSSLTGTTDMNEFGLNRQVFNAPITGAFTFAASPAARNPFQVISSAPFSNTIINFDAYVVDGNKFFLVGVDSNRVIVGTIIRQP